MEIIEDKRVGELWQCASADGCGNFSKGEIQRLIRKLVDQRAVILAMKMYGTKNIAQADVDAHIPDAAREFGIDPATWSEK